MQGTDYQDLDTTPEKTPTTRTPAANIAHLASTTRPATHTGLRR
ncbi:hypothetical protein SAVIM40S_07828 [Streptomyces avidinii]|uniref:Uncharacterized protein n=1 Tax=Streptomyces avidinii TaxID=1895 RepID=A0ABS4KY46_STRAV|nr:hypothetical protein [Streptomyces avidinii]